LKEAADERARKFEVGTAILCGFQNWKYQWCLSTFADDVCWSIPGPKDIIPFVGQRRGHEQVAQYSKIC
jgi:hypothetical protein